METLTRRHRMHTLHIEFVKYQTRLVQTLSRLTHHPISPPTSNEQTKQLAVLAQHSTHTLKTTQRQRKKLPVKPNSDNAHFVSLFSARVNISVSVGESMRHTRSKRRRRKRGNAVGICSTVSGANVGLYLMCRDSRRLHRRMYYCIEDKRYAICKSDLAYQNIKHRFETKNVHRTIPATCSTLDRASNGATVRSNAHCRRETVRPAQSAPECDTDEPLPTPDCSATPSSVRAYPDAHCCPASANANSPATESCPTNVSSRTAHS